MYRDRKQSALSPKRSMRSVSNLEVGYQIYIKLDFHKKSHMAGFPIDGHICDRIWENPLYGINAQFAQCAFLVPLVRNCRSSDFVIYMSKNLSSNCYRRLRRLVVTYQGEISLYLQAPRSTVAVHGARCYGR